MDSVGWVGCMGGEDMILGDECVRFLCCWAFCFHGMVCYGVECFDICKLFGDGIG